MINSVSLAAAHSPLAALVWLVQNIFSFRVNPRLSAFFSHAALVGHRLGDPWAAK